MEESNKYVSQEGLQHYHSILASSLKGEIPTDPFNGHDYVEIGGLYWATKNIGAQNIADTGLYFQWGNPIGYDSSEIGTEEGQKKCNWEEYPYSNEDGTVITKYNDSDNLTQLELIDDAARVNMGGLWRMPTKEEFEILKNSTTISWETNYNGSRGALLTDNNDNSKSIFFPSTYDISNGEVNIRSYEGNYWTSSLGERTPYNMNFFIQNNMSIIDAIVRYVGFTVRGVIDPNDIYELNIPKIPVKTSDLINDTGYLTQHQDISGKADLSDLNGMYNALGREISDRYQGLTANINTVNNKFGGMTLVKISESDYEALTSKDNNTLYIVY